MLHTLRCLLLTPLLAFMLLTQPMTAEEMTQQERNEMAAKLIPIITMLLMDDGDKTPPAVPTLSEPLDDNTTNPQVSFELNGEVGAVVYVDGVAVLTVGSDGKAIVVLDLKSGNNAFDVTLKDKAGNESKVLKLSIVSDAVPTLALNGERSITLSQGDSYEELGAVAQDKEDGDLSSHILTTGTVQSDTIGHYTIHYSVTDSMGHSVAVDREIEVIKLEAVANSFEVTETNLSTEAENNLTVEGLVEDSKGNTGTADGLTDVVARKEVTTTDAEGNSVTKEVIVFRSFNIGEWAGKLNEETTMLARIFMTPTLMGVPEETKIAYITHLKTAYAEDYNDTLKYQSYMIENSFFTPIFYEKVEHLQAVLEQKYTEDIASGAVVSPAVKSTRKSTRSYRLPNNDFVNMSMMQLKAGKKDDGESDTLKFYNYTDVYYGLRVGVFGETDKDKHYPTFPQDDLHIINPVKGGAVGGLANWLINNYLPKNFEQPSTPVEYNKLLNRKSDIVGVKDVDVELYKNKYMDFDYTTILNAANGISLLAKTMSFSGGNYGEKVKKALSDKDGLLLKTKNGISGVDFALSVGLGVIDAIELVSDTQRFDSLKNTMKKTEKLMSDVYKLLDIKPYKGTVEEMSVVSKLLGNIVTKIPDSGKGAYEKLKEKLDTLPIRKKAVVMATASLYENIVHKFIKNNSELKAKIAIFEEKYKEVITFKQMPYYLVLKSAKSIKPSDIDGNMAGAGISYAKRFITKNIVKELASGLNAFSKNIASVTASTKFVTKFLKNTGEAIKKADLMDTTWSIVDWLVKAEIVNVKELLEYGIPKAIAISLNPATGAVKAVKAVNDWSSYLTGMFLIPNSQYFRLKFDNGKVTVGLPPVQVAGVSATTAKGEESHISLGDAYENVKNTYIIDGTDYLVPIGTRSVASGHNPVYQLVFQEAIPDGWVFDGSFEDLLEEKIYKGKTVFELGLVVEQSSDDSGEKNSFIKSYSKSHTGIQVSAEDIRSVDLASGSNGASTLDLIATARRSGSLSGYMTKDDTRGVFREYATVKMKPSLDKKKLVGASTEVKESDKKYMGYNILNKYDIKDGLTLSVLEEEDIKTHLVVKNTLDIEVCYGVSYEIDVDGTVFDTTHYVPSDCVDPQSQKSIALDKYKDNGEFNAMKFYFYDGLADKFFENSKLYIQKKEAYTKTANIKIFEKVYPVIAYAVNPENLTENKAPIAVITGSSTAHVGDTITLSATQSSDEDGQIVKYVWQENYAGEKIEGETRSFVAEDEGMYYIYLTVTDDMGAVDTVNLQIEVTKTTTSTTLLKKTGQTTSYYAGDDGDLQMGVTPSYSRANEVVTDNITGLQWQDNAEAKTVTKTWDESKSYCGALGLDGGGWRLPTIQELQSIVVDGAYNPSIDTTAFINYTTSHYYWSSTTCANNTGYAWVVYFHYGYTHGNSKSYTYYVRCVR